MNGNGFGKQGGQCANNSGAKGAGKGRGRGQGMCRRAPGTAGYESGIGGGQLRAAEGAAGQSLAGDMGTTPGDVSVQASGEGLPVSGRGDCGGLRRRDGSCGRKA